MSDLPLVQGLQNKLGKDKVGVLLVSVDTDGGAGINAEMKSRGVDLPVTTVPGGFSETESRFGMTGYGIVLVRPDGVVKGKEVSTSELEGMIQVN